MSFASFDEKQNKTWSENKSQKMGSKCSQSEEDSLY